MTKPYLTKIGLGRWWFYLDTKRKWTMRSHSFLGWTFLIISYNKSLEEA